MMILMIIISLLIDKKHTTIGSIQKSHFIEFDLTHLTIISVSDHKRYNWVDMKNILFRIHDYKGETRIGAGDMINTYNGTMNYISFKIDSKVHRYHFFLADEPAKKRIIDMIEIKLAPKLKKLKLLDKVLIRN